MFIFSRSNLCIISLFIGVVVSYIGTEMNMFSSNVCSFEINFRGENYRIGITSYFILRFDRF